MLFFQDGRQPEDYDKNRAYDVQKLRSFLSGHIPDSIKNFQFEELISKNDSYLKDALMASDFYAKDHIDNYDSLSTPEKIRAAVAYIRKKRKLKTYNMTEDEGRAETKNELENFITNDKRRANTLVTVSEVEELLSKDDWLKKRTMRICDNAAKSKNLENYEGLSPMDKIKTVVAMTRKLKGIDE